MQTGARSATDTFSRFVEGDEHHPGTAKSGPDPEKQDFWDSFASAGETRMAEQEAARKKKMEPERKDFWDEFASVGEQRVQQKTSAGREQNVGAAAMRKNTPGGGRGGAAKDDEWEQW